MILIVSLKSEIERRSRVAEVLERSNFTDYYFIDGIDGKTLTEEEYNELQNRKKVTTRAGREMSRGELGCAISHRMAAEHMIKTCAESALIIEDDICINPDFRHAINIAINSNLIIRSTPTIITLGPIRKFKNKPRIKLCDGVDIVHIVKSWGAVGYIINRAAALSIIKTQSPIQLMADDWQEYSKIAKIKIYGIDPFIIAEAKEDKSSILEPQRVVMRKIKIGGMLKFRYLIRKFVSSFISRLLILPIYGIRSHKIEDSAIRDWTQ